MFSEGIERNQSGMKWVNIEIHVMCKFFAFYNNLVEPLKLIVVRCTIWYHLYNLKNLKNIHGGVLILVKLQAFEAFNFTKINTAAWVFFSRFLNCTNGTKSRDALQFVCKRIFFGLNAT